METLTHPAIIAALVTAVVMLVGILAAHRLSMSRERRAQRVAACSKFRSIVLAGSSLVPAAEYQWDKTVLPVLQTIANDIGVAVTEFAPHIGTRKHLLQREYQSFAVHCRETIPKALDAAEILYGGGPTSAAVAKQDYYARVQRLVAYASEI